MFISRNFCRKYLWWSFKRSNLYDRGRL